MKINEVVESRQKILLTFVNFFSTTLRAFMSALKNKSEFNLEAANALHEKSLYAPSVHCAYYSVLQLMKFAVFSTMGINYEDQTKEINALKKDKASSKGTHEYLIMKVEDVIRGVNRIEYTEFTRNVKQLKIFRVNSDYDDVEITYDQSSKAIYLANNLRKQLKKTFKV